MRFLRDCLIILIGVLAGAMIVQQIERRVDFDERFCFNAVRTGALTVCYYGDTQKVNE